MLTFRRISPEDVELCHELEVASYPEDEAASLKKMELRQKYAGEYFRCALLNGKIIGFINSTRCKEFTEESMSQHDPDGELLAVHSVVINQVFRRRGYARSMLRNYVKCIANEQKLKNGQKNTSSPVIKKLVLIAKQHLLKFYISCGFTVIGLSNLIHGRDPWFDLDLDLIEYNHSQFWVVDSFTKAHGSGNPAAVVLLDGRRDKQWMLKVAAEFNLSETAFIWKNDYDDSDNISTKDNAVDDEVHYFIRYFTPTDEVDLCGHATLASGKVLFKELNSIRQIVFHAKYDVLPVTKDSKGKISMIFPYKETDDIKDLSADIREPVTRMVIDAFFDGDKKTASKNCVYIGIGKDKEDILVEVTPRTFSSLKSKNINIEPFLACDSYTRGVIVCCEGSNNEKIDFKSRFFGPKVGIKEDPVTGSAHCLLAPHFSSKMRRKATLVGYQDSKRGGLITCELLGTATDDKRMVRIKGYATVASSGKLEIK